MPRLQVESAHGPVRRELIKQLMAFNDSVIGKSKFRRLSITLRKGREIVGGVHGHTWMGWLYVDLLWVAAKWRGKGYGTKLLKKAEAEAKKRGVSSVYVATFSFQAPAFYKKLGYRPFGKLVGYPPGREWIWFAKAQ